MALQYNIDSILDLTDGDVTIDAQVVADVPSGTAYDAAFFFTGNFLSGDYRQDSTDVQSAVSNLFLDETGFKASRAYLADESGLTADGRSAYGNTAAQTLGGLRVTAATEYFTINQAGPNLGAVSTHASIGDGTTLIPMINMHDTPRAAGTEAAGGEGLGRGHTDMGAALVQLATIALFKKYGKNVAINNDVSLVDTFKAKLYNVIGTEVNEFSKSYDNSKFFKRYLASGRHAADDAQIGDGSGLAAAQSYTVDNTVFNMIVKVSGHVSDSTAAGESPVLTDENIATIFGAIGGENPAHLIKSGGDYETHCFISLKQDNRL